MVGVFGGVEERCPWVLEDQFGSQLRDAMTCFDPAARVAHYGSTLGVQCGGDRCWVECPPGMLHQLAA